MEEIKQQLELLSRHGVECVIVGGVAAALHGSSISTYDLDVCYARDTANLHRLAAALDLQHQEIFVIDKVQNAFFSFSRQKILQGLVR